MLFVSMPLGGLAMDAAPRPFSNISLQAIPNKACNDKAASKTCDKIHSSTIGHAPLKILLSVLLRRLGPSWND